MGGEIGVRSAVNQGSCFWFTVPLQYSLERDSQWSSAVTAQAVPAAFSSVVKTDSTNINQSPTSQSGISVTVADPKIPVEASHPPRTVVPALPLASLVQGSSCNPAVERSVISVDTTVNTVTPAAAVAATQPTEHAFAVPLPPSAVKSGTALSARKASKSSLSGADAQALANARRLSKPSSRVSSMMLGVVVNASSPRLMQSVPTASSTVPSMVGADHAPTADVMNAGVPASLRLGLRSSTAQAASTVAAASVGASTSTVPSSLSPAAGTGRTSRSGGIFFPTQVISSTAGCVSPAFATVQPDSTGSATNVGSSSKPRSTRATHRPHQPSNFDSPLSSSSVTCTSEVDTDREDSPYSRSLQEKAKLVVDRATGERFGWPANNVNGGAAATATAVEQVDTEQCRPSVVTSLDFGSVSTAPAETSASSGAAITWPLASPSSQAQVSKQRSNEVLQQQAVSPQTVRPVLTTSSPVMNQSSEHAATASDPTPSNKGHPQQIVVDGSENAVVPPVLSAVPADSSAATVTAPAAVKAVHRVLVVDDSEMNRKIILKLIDKYAPHLLTDSAVNGLEAIDMVHSAPQRHGAQYSLVLMVGD